MLLEMLDKFMLAEGEVSNEGFDEQQAAMIKAIEVQAGHDFLPAARKVTIPYGPVDLLEVEVSSDY
eukprot:3169275-Lingulodinium_polyedra.AAC.1